MSRGETWEADAAELRALRPRHVLFLCPRAVRALAEIGIDANDEERVPAFRGVRDELRRRLSLVFGR